MNHLLKGKEFESSSEKFLKLMELIHKTCFELS